MSRSLFVERFLVPAEEVGERPAGLRYDSALAVTVWDDGEPFVDGAASALTATDTKAFPGDRDQTDARSAEVTKVKRDTPRPLPVTEETAVLRDRPGAMHPLVELWTRTGTRRDQGENVQDVLLHEETRVRRDRPQERRLAPRKL